MTVLSGPPTVLLHPGAPQTSDPANVVTFDFAVKGGPSGVLVPLFIGAELAERFVLSLGEEGKGITLLQLDGFDALENLLVGLQQAGATHVDVNADRDSPKPIPIANVIDRLRNRPRR